MDRKKAKAVPKKAMVKQTRYSHPIDKLKNYSYKQDREKKLLKSPASNIPLNQQLQ